MITPRSCSVCKTSQLESLFSGDVLIELTETQALSSDWTSAHRTLNRLPILSISASSSHIFNSAQNLYLSMTPDCISLLVYRLVHAPVTTMSARKRGSTPRQRVFSSWSCDLFWSYITSIIVHVPVFSDHSQSPPRQRWVGKRPRHHKIYSRGVSKERNRGLSCTFTKAKLYRLGEM